MTVDLAIPNLAADLDLPRVPQQARSRQKRDAILAAAADLFAAKGYEATTADDIANAAEVSIGTFYSYFRNKRQVFLTLFADSFERLLGLGIADLDFEVNPRQAVHETVRRAMAYDERDYGLRRAWLEMRLRDPELVEYTERLHTFIYRQLLAAIKAAAGCDLTWPDLDLEAATWAITLLLDRAWDMDPLAPGPDGLTYDRLCDAIAEIIYRSLFREEKGTQGN